MNLNSGNLCIFEGRLSKDPTYSTIQYNSANGPQTLDKAFFTVAVNRKLSASDREKAKTDSSIKTADFIPFSLIGKPVATLKQFFAKGKPIRIVAHYTEYQTSGANGQVEYKHCFEVDDIAFTVSDSQGQGNNNQNQQNNNGGQQNYNNYNNANNFPGGYQQPQQGYMPPPQPQRQQAPAQNNNFAMFDSSSDPF